MGGIINNKGGARAGQYGSKALHVRGFPYSNTAAKFWTSMLDEVLAAYPHGTSFELSASTGGQLLPSLLSPEELMQRSMDRLVAEGNTETVQDAMAVLELIGPPGGITLKLIPPGPDPRVHEIELDYLDADLLPFLVAWLLEWAGVPDALWNESRVRGAFSGDDRARRYRYLMAFELRNQLLSEELYRRSLRLNFRREPLAKPAPASPAPDAPDSSPAAG